MRCSLGWELKLTVFVGKGVSVGGTDVAVAVFVGSGVAVDIGVLVGSGVAV